MKYAQLVMGSAGTGKSTYCHAIQEHAAARGRTVRVANFDPAAESFKYAVAFDIRDLISVDDVMSEMQFGPNGALIFCMEYLVENLEWLREQADSFLDDDYLLIDCPGQIELYSHVNVMAKVAQALVAADFNLCAVYLLDATFVTDAAKLISGNLAALAAMVHLELPHINVRLWGFMVPWGLRPFRFVVCGMPAATPACACPPRPVDPLKVLPR
jgi:GPN-loop GTPase